MTDRCPTTGKPIRRLDTAWYLKNDPNRYGTPSAKARATAVIHGSTKAAEVRYREIIKRVEAELEKRGECAQYSLLCEMGISGNAFETAMATMDHRIHRRRELKRGCRWLLSKA